MLIIAGHLKVPADQRQGFIDAHTDLVTRARAFPGCVDLAISPDPIDPTRINNVEIWDSEAVLKEWRKVSNAPKTGIQIQSGNMQKHHISHSESPF